MGYGPIEALLRMALKMNYQTGEEVMLHDRVRYPWGDYEEAIVTEIFPANDINSKKVCEEYYQYGGFWITYPNGCVMGLWKPEEEEDIELLARG